MNRVRADADRLRPAQRSGLFAFNDVSENVRTEMGRGGKVNVLNFGGNYGSLIDVAGGEPQLESLDGLIDDARVLGRTKDLATANGSQRAGIAAAMIKQIGAFSEAARFTDFRDTWDPVIAGRTGGGYYAITSPKLRALRGAWGRISQFAVDITNVPATPPLTVDGVGTFSTWQDVRDHLRVILR
ncbi:ribosome-inactivating family protein [Microbispora sp. CA-135349]|uniref:ribosome-inactivating family protein n=1 Tax=Microbispora sp. CA-135349 TaxID=3239953 RepID=UPI003D89DE5C